jgi:hypothetical protein
MVWKRWDEAMEATLLVQDIASLPPEAQKQVLDFVAFLKTRYPAQSRGRKVKRTKIADEPFIGMWRDREDMQDSGAWVRRLREREWEQGG